MQVEDVHGPPSRQCRQGSQDSLWVAGEVRAEQVDGVAGGVSEGGGQGCQEIPAGAAADGVDPGQSHVHCVWGAGEHVVGPAGHLWSR